MPAVPPDYVMEDFTQRAAESWGVGQKQTDNGVVLFVFPQDRKTRIEVGYGLEGVLPDVTGKRIIQNEIVPAFRAGDYDAGITRGVDAIQRALCGEYQGAGRTVAETERMADDSGIPLIMVIFFARYRNSLKNGTCYGPRGRRDVWSPPFGGGGWGGSSGRSSGGGSFGGGGASGGWWRPVSPARISRRSAEWEGAEAGHMQHLAVRLVIGARVVASRVGFMRAEM